MPRRVVLQGDVATGAVLAAALSEPVDAATPTVAATAPLPSDASPLGPVVMETMRFTVHGQERVLALDARPTLLDALREHLHLTGAKTGCDHGQCGACTVLADGRRIKACLSLAVMHDGGQAVTIEGLADGEALHPTQAAFRGGREGVARRHHRDRVN